MRVVARRLSRFFFLAVCLGTCPVLMAFHLACSLDAGCGAELLGVVRLFQFSGPVVELLVVFLSRSGSHLAPARCPLPTGRRPPPLGNGRKPIGSAATTPVVPFPSLCAANGGR